MAIPYQTAKFKSTNILAIAILGSTAKFNSRQYYSTLSMLAIRDWGLTQRESWNLKQAGIYYCLATARQKCELKVN